MTRNCCLISGYKITGMWQTAAGRDHLEIYMISSLVSLVYFSLKPYTQHHWQLIGVMPSHSLNELGAVQSFVRA